MKRGDRLRVWAYGRPILGLFVADVPLSVPAVHAWIVRHRRLGLFWRDPYGVRARFGDPRSDWGREDRAWRFTTEAEARRQIIEQDVPGVLVRLTVREGNNL